MKYTEALQKRADWLSDFGRKINLGSLNDKLKKEITEPQARAAADASFDQMKNNLVSYGIPALAGAGVAGIGAYSVAEWINEHRKKQKETDSEVLPSKLLASLAAAGGAIGGVMLYDRYGKKASYGDIPVVPDPALEVSPEEQEALEDPSKSKKKKKEKTPDKIKQMIYAQNAKTRREQMKNASLTYSKVAALMKQADEYEWWTKPNQATEYAVFEKRGPTDPTKQQEAEVWGKAWNNPGVAFTWDDDSRQYIPTQYDKNLKTNVPYKGNINTPAPATNSQSWDRWGSTQPKQAPATPSTNTQGQGIPPKTNFTTPKPVQPVQPPQYRQADTTVKDVEGFR